MKEGGVKPEHLIFSCGGAYTKGGATDTSYPSNHILYINEIIFTNGEIKR